ncbi:MAG: hypothetical protein ABIE03_03940 [Patescibacteria group bacterium]|nr:hypothetical protein [Patescibacteria group bacterium]
MDDKSAQTFGCFLGILLAVFFSLPLYLFFDLPMWAEYVITGVLLLVFGVVGNLIVRAINKPKIPIPQKPITVEGPKPVK